MPGMDGYEACQIIKQLVGDRKTKIVACTAQAYSQIESQFVSSGMDGFIEKPMQMGSLEVEYKKCVNGSDGKETA